MADNEQAVAVELAQLREQVKTVGENVSEIKATMAALISLDKTIAELAIYSKQTQDNVRLLWERFEESKQWQQAHERELHEVRKISHDALDNVRDEVHKEILTTDRKVEAWTNRVRGASWAAGIIMGVVQVAVFASIGWTFTNVTSLRESSQVDTLRIDRLEERAQKRDAEEREQDIRLRALQQQPATIIDRR
ncbi:hypothetical protein 19_00033 [Pseudomonas phage Epa19]|nr:hypothetical protein 19_00033 [Pseudomonas phage Epa19]